MTFTAGSTVTVTWSPESVYPLEEPDLYTVDITLYFFHLSMGTRTEAVQLAPEIPNSGSALITMPNVSDIATFSIQVTAVTFVSRMEMNISSLLSRHVGVWSRYAYVVVSDMLQSKCYSWWNSQQEMVGDKLLAEVSLCPPTMRHASVDSNFIHNDFSISRILHPGSEECFRENILYV